MNDIYKMLKLIIYLTYIVNTVYSSYCVPQVVDMYRPYYTQNITVDYNMADKNMRESIPTGEFIKIHQGKFEEEILAYF
jgi:hypothetical protein